MGREKAEEREGEMETERRLRKGRERWRQREG